MNNKGRWVVVWVGLFLMVLMVGGFLVKGIIDNALYNRFPDRGVPRINIDLNGVSLEEVKSGSKETKYEGNDLQVYDGGVILEYGGVEIKGRGNGTWVQEKKPFQIKFENKVDMFGMGAARKWYLLANAADETKIRNDIASYIGNMLEMKYIFEGKYVELYMNSEYEGLYYLTHAIEIKKNAIDLKDKLGLLAELDNVYGVYEDYFESGNKDKIVIKDVVANDSIDAATDVFLRDYNDFEKAVREKNYSRICELVDVRSFAQYFLINEFSVNPDAYWTSFYMYKDGVNDKIHAGPAWDFDMAFANRNWWNWLGERFYSPAETMIRKNELLSLEEYKEMGLEEWFTSGDDLSTIVFDLMDIPEFKKMVSDVYVETMRGRKKELIAAIFRKVNMIKNAIMADNDKWGNDDFDESIAELLNWIAKRFDYFESEYGEGNNSAVVLY